MEQISVGGERMYEKSDLRWSTFERDLGSKLARFWPERSRVGKGAKNSHGHIDDKDLHCFLAGWGRISAWVLEYYGLNDVSLEKGSRYGSLLEIWK